MVSSTSDLTAINVRIFKIWQYLKNTSMEKSPFTSSKESQNNRFKTTPPNFFFHSVPILF